MFNFLLVLFAVVVCAVAVAGVAVPVIWYKDIKKLMDKDYNRYLDSLEGKEVIQK